ncbi:hypothetical protein PENSPDRAFT_739581 [Peniophora sp. CONT]|nr:hypothetical protein PENSPDRAFT_739581 [Peniophora sp. CONT]
MFSNNFAKLAAVCAALASSASAINHSISYTVYPNTAAGLTCTGPPLTTTPGSSPFTNGTIAHPVCHNLGTATPAFAGRFTLAVSVPPGVCTLQYFSAVNCGGAKGPVNSTLPLGYPLVPGMGVCEPLEFATPLPVHGALSVEVNCVI